MESSILCDVLVVATRLVKSNVLKVTGSQFLLWLSFYDLILEGVEANIDNRDVLYAFLQFIQIQANQRLPPQEMHQRIFSTVCRGRDAHVDDFRFQTATQQQLHRFIQVEDSDDSLRIIVMVDGRNNNLKQQSGIDPARYSNPFRRCAPAA